MDVGVSRRRVLGLAGVGAATVATGILGDASATGALTLGGNGPTPMGSIGVTQGQVARLSAVNYDDAASGGVPGGGCVVALEIHRLTGELLASQQFRLAPGQGAFLDASNIAGQSPREQIYGVVEHIVQPLDLTGPNHTMGATLEVFDAQTGRTTAIVLPAVQRILEAAIRPR